ncbi:unnamed protein product [Parascedosporium putredinis]|uniref:Dynein light intermediate chain n=1 Tax=Parascedosporium putredinis TaxID=1442378 RepID=A0A9P1M6D4_9PEZI|nr:unnamed protein product [Parascedosporium putredinis]CAI7988270.1 unnamed protein product [Parascedosporium putredinis]
MTPSANRISTYTSTSVQSDGRNGDQKKDLWTCMLDSVASGKRLPEKNVLVFGGTPESQREFLDSLSNGDQRRLIDRQRVPPIANNFALGYTYYDVLDADQEDTLARISLYLLSTPSPAFTSLIKPLLTPETIPNTLIVVLLDWSGPHLFLRQLQEWILMLRDILQSLDARCVDAMQDVMVSWRDRGRGGGTVNLDGSGADRMEMLEKSQGWKEADFDQILQYLRTILLRHSRAPNWDSWGKIRVLREGFDVETVSNGWADDIRQDWPLAPTSNGYRRGDEDGDPFTSQGSDVDRHQQELSALTHYEDWVPDASAGGLQLTEPGSSDPMRLEVISDDPQKFLLDQGKLLDMLKKPADDLDLVRAGAVGSIVSDHIGPVQFNMGGIQVDADDMVQRLKDRQDYSSTPDPTTPPQIRPLPRWTIPPASRLSS